MDKQRIIEEAKQTLNNINETKLLLDDYVDRLNKIIKRLENETYPDKYLTSYDMKVIREKEELLNTENNNDESVMKKRGFAKETKKNRFNVTLLIGVILLSLTMGLNYFKNHELITIQNKAYFIYREHHKEPRLLSNALIISESKVAKPHELLVYLNHNQVIRIKEVSEVLDEKYILKGTQQFINTEEEVSFDQVVGVVEKQMLKVGKLLAIVMEYLWILYLLSIILIVGAIIL